MNQTTPTSPDKVVPVPVPTSALAVWESDLRFHRPVPADACQAVIDEIYDLIQTSTSVEEAQTFASALVVAFPKEKSNRPFVLAMAEEIEEFPPDIVSKTVRHLRRSEKSLPSIAEVIDACNDLQRYYLDYLDLAEEEILRPIWEAEEAQKAADRAEKKERVQRQEQREQAIRQRRYARDQRETVRKRQRFLKKTAKAWSVFPIGLEFPVFKKVIDLLNEYDLVDETFREICERGELSSWALSRLLRGDAVRYLLMVRREPFNSWGWVSKHLKFLLVNDIQGAYRLGFIIKHEQRDHYPKDVAAEREAKALIKKFLERREKMITNDLF
jgi:hypothetical protein